MTRLPHSAPQTQYSGSFRAKWGGTPTARLVLSAADPRLQSFNLAGFPVEMTDLDHWVAWRLEPTSNGPKPYTKVPINPKTGTGADSTKPKTWSSLDLAISRCERDDLAGIGFMFGGSGLTGIDLDGCRDAITGAVAPWAQQIVDRFNSYTEVSVSGTGIHIIVRGQLPPGGRRRQGPIEMYDAGRYFTMTGKAIDGEGQS